MTAHAGEEFSPLMPHTAPTSSQRKLQKKRRQERQHRRSSEGLSPDTPGPSSDSDYVGSDEDFHATDLTDLSGRPALLPISQASNDLSRTLPTHEDV
ncbi:unnamed protein product [Dibothriocephalus latus]|uniref:Uncharacterized protein n=1 Tax=Dibothriocephalus latus TaxID=60516 RepID=A0A3P7MAU9_DIBLA|nr:unnamed protein product [Dibothriocephalus latus]